MKNSCIVGFVFLLLLGQSALMAQNKHMLSASFSGGVGAGILVMRPIVEWNESLERLEDRNLRYHGKVHLHYEYLFSKRFALGLLVQLQSFRTPIERISSAGLVGSSFSFGSEIESPVFTSTAPLLSLNWTPHKSLLPIGIKHTFAIGPKFYAMDHDREYTGVYNLNITDPSDPLYDFPDTYETEQFPEDYSNNYLGISLMYGLTGSFAIAEDVYLQLGLDTHLDFALASSYERPEFVYDQSNPEGLTPKTAKEYMSYQFNTRRYNDEINNRDGWNIFMLRFGMMYNL